MTRPRLERVIPVRWTTPFVARQTGRCVLRRLPRRGKSMRKRRSIRGFKKSRSAPRRWHPSVKTPTWGGSCRCTTSIRSVPTTTRGGRYFESKHLGDSKIEEGTLLLVINPGIQPPPLAWALTIFWHLGANLTRYSYCTVEIALIWLGLVGTIAALGIAKESLAALQMADPHQRRLPGRGALPLGTGNAPRSPAPLAGDARRRGGCGQLGLIFCNA